VSNLIVNIGQKLICLLLDLDPSRISHSFSSTYTFHNSLMMNGRNNGKKIMAVRIVQHAFEIIHLVTEQNPVQVLGELLILE
jgi:ribosomal protein S7